MEKLKNSESLGIFQVGNLKNLKVPTIYLVSLYQLNILIIGLNFFFLEDINRAWGLVAVACAILTVLTSMSNRQGNKKPSSGG